MLNADIIARAVGVQYPIALAWLPQLQAVFARNAIASREEQAMFLAQTGHESGGFSRLSENLNYSASGLLATFSRHFNGQTERMAYARNPERIANRVYADRLGNGNEASGDGWAYRGRGLIQITGRRNYRACGEALGVDFEGYPEMLINPKYAALSAGWFWSVNGCGIPARSGNVRTVTRIINGGMAGLDDRQARYDRAFNILGETP